MRIAGMSIVAVLLALAACSRSPLDQGMDQITADRLRSHIAVLAADSLEGRGPATIGEQRAIRYIESQYKEMGLEPAGENGTYVQDVPLVGFRLDPSVTLDLGRGQKKLRLKYRDDFIAFTGVFEPVVKVDGAEVVFVGYGIDAPEQHWNDYKGANLRGKVLLMMNDDPNTDDNTFFAGKGRTYYGRWDYKYEEAARQGAVGAIVIHTTASAGYPFQVVQSSWYGENFELASESSSPALKLKAWTTEDATKRLLALADFDLARLTAMAQERSFRPVPLGLKLSVTMKYTIRHLVTHNVLGLVRGGNPELNHQAIVFTAHYDHFGLGKPVKGDSIYNGALDNASGVSMILTLAKAFSVMNPKPDRSVLIAAVAAEERGLLGSEYFAHHPTLPARDLIANINVDGINIWGRTSDIVFLGADHSSLGADVAAVARTMGLTVKPDQFPEQGSFYRSDQFSFAKVGIPCLSLDSGTDYVGKPVDYAKKQVDEYINEHYHQPSDELRDDWNYDGALQQGEFLLRLTLRIADAQTLPQWNPGDEFASARNAAMTPGP